MRSAFALCSGGRYDQPRQYFDTQEGTVFRRGGRLCRELPLAPSRDLPLTRSPWRFAGSPAVAGPFAARWPTCPASGALASGGGGPAPGIACAARRRQAARSRGLATRDLTVVVEQWSFAGTAPPAGGQDYANCRTQTRAFHAARRRQPAAPRPPGTGGAVLARGGGSTDRATTAPTSTWSWPNMRARWECGASGRQSGWDPLTAGLALIGRLPPGLAAPRGLLRAAFGDSLDRGVAQDDQAAGHAAGELRRRHPVRPASRVCP